MAPASAVTFGDGEGGEEGRGETRGAEEEEGGNTALRRDTILRRCFGARVAVGKGMEVLGGKGAGIQANGMGVIDLRINKVKRGEA